MLVQQPAQIVRRTLNKSAFCSSLHQPVRHYTYARPSSIVGICTFTSIVHCLAANVAFRESGSYRTRLSHDAILKLLYQLCLYGTTDPSSRAAIAIETFNVQSGEHPRFASCTRSLSTTCEMPESISAYASQSPKVKTRSICNAKYCVILLLI